MLMRIFGPKRDTVTGEWRRLHNEQLYGLYLSKIIRGPSAGHVARMGERDTYRVGKSEGERQLRGPRHRWEDSVKTGLQELGSWHELH